MPRDYMVKARKKQKLTITQMAARCAISTGLIRLLEEDETSVTHPNIARRVGEAYGLSNRRTLMLMPEHHRPGKNYNPYKYKIEEDPEDIFRQFKVIRRSKGGVAV